MIKSTRKFIRREKARIRRQVLDTKKQEEMINDMYGKILNQPKEKESKPEEKKQEAKTVKEIKKGAKSKTKKTKKID